MPAQRGEMICADLHIHTQYSWDSTSTLEQYCESAIEKGIKHICFTDHYEVEPEDPGYGYYEIDRYFEGIKRVQDKYSGQIDVLAGVEFAEPHHDKKLFEKFKTYPFDFILGSIHWAHNSFAEGIMDLGYSYQESCAFYYQEMKNMVEYGGFDAVSHFDLLKRYHGDTIYTQEMIREIMELAVRNNILIEINTSSVRRSHLLPMPDHNILEIYHKAGGEYVTLGSDGHHHREVGADFEAAIQELPVGMGTGYFRKHRFIPLGKKEE